MSTGERYGRRKDILWNSVVAQMRRGNAWCEGMPLSLAKESWFYSMLNAAYDELKWGADEMNLGAEYNEIIDKL